MGLKGRSVQGLVDAITKSLPRVRVHAKREEAPTYSPKKGDCKGLPKSNLEKQDSIE